MGVATSGRSPSQEVAFALSSFPVQKAQRGAANGQHHQSHRFSCRSSSRCGAFISRRNKVVRPTLVSAIILPASIMKWSSHVWLRGWNKRTTSSLSGSVLVRLGPFSRLQCLQASARFSSYPFRDVVVRQCARCGRTEMAPIGVAFDNTRNDPLLAVEQTTSVVRGDSSGRLLQLLSGLGLQDSKEVSEHDAALIFLSFFSSQ
jgi:hypothetical protein